MAPRKSSHEISDEESAGDEIPFKRANKATSDDEEDNEEEGSEDEDVYVVESIVGHEFQKNGQLMLIVKWKGYDDPSDKTLEPEDGLLEGAEDAVQEYYDKIGGRPELAGGTKSGKGKRKSTATSAKATPERATAKKQKLTAKDGGINGAESFGPDIPEGIPEWVRDKAHWGTDVVRVQTIEHDPEHGLVAYLNWTNDKTTRVSIEKCYENIPLLMLKFYEAHLVFKDNSPE